MHTSSEPGSSHGTSQSVQQRILGIVTHSVPTLTEELRPQMGILLGVILNPSLSGWTQRWFISHSCPGDSGFLQSVTWLLYLPRSSRSNQGGKVTGGHHGPVRWHMWHPLTSHWLELSHMITSTCKGGWETEFPGRRGHWCGDPIAGCHRTQQWENGRMPSL